MIELLVGLFGVLIGYFAKSQLDQDRDALGRYEDNKEKQFLHDRDRLEELYELVDACKTKVSVRPRPPYNHIRTC